MTEPKGLTERIFELYFSCIFLYWSTGFINSLILRDSISILSFFSENFLEFYIILTLNSLSYGTIFMFFVLPIYFILSKTRIKNYKHISPYNLSIGSLIFFPITLIICFDDYNYINHSVMLLVELVFIYILMIFIRSKIYKEEVK